MSEPRTCLRNPAFKGGSISFALATGIECTVRNVSAIGAYLVIGSSSLSVPDDFTLIIMPERVKRSCRVAWRSGNRIGVHFV
jgi:hypothetical protein